MVRRLTSTSKAMTQCDKRTDGPQPASADLYRFLTENNVPSTHFMIGSRIVDNPELFEEAVQMGGNIAVHTWSCASLALPNSKSVLRAYRHPLMTTMTDSEVREATYAV